LEIHSERPRTHTCGCRETRNGPTINPLLLRNGPVPRSSQSHRDERISRVWKSTPIALELTLAGAGRLGNGPTMNPLPLRNGPVPRSSQFHRDERVSRFWKSTPNDLELTLAGAGRLGNVPIINPLLLRNGPVPRSSQVHRDERVSWIWKSTPNDLELILVGTWELDLSQLRAPLRHLPKDFDFSLPIRRPIHPEHIMLPNRRLVRHIRPLP